MIYLVLARNGVSWEVAASDPYTAMVFVAESEDVPIETLRARQPTQAMTWHGSALS